MEKRLNREQYIWAMIGAEQILYIDKYLAVVDKPQGLQCEPDKMGHPDLLTETKKYLNRINKPPKLIQPVNRIDRPVGGLVLLAFTATALKALNEMQEARKIKKHYRALVSGHINPPEGEWQNWMVKDPMQKRAMVFNTELRGSKICVLNYKTIEIREENSLIEIELKTGRYHQIRAQAGANGHPILGDTLYGSKDALAPASISLQAFRLQFTHPLSGEEIDISTGPIF